MRLFKRGPVGVCDFCGADGISVHQVDHHRSEPIEEVYCAACGTQAGELEARMACVERDGWAVWLRCDPGTERAITVTEDPFPSAHAALEGLGAQLREVPPAAARIVSLRRNVFASDPKGSEHGSLDEAIAHVGGKVAREVELEYERLRKAEQAAEPWPLASCSVGLCGDGAGIVYQEVLPSDGMWLHQWCHLIDTDHVVHSYFNYHR